MEQLVTDFVAAKGRYQLEADALEQNNLSYNALKEKHSYGLVSSVELVTAKGLLYAEQSKYLQAKYALYFNYKLLQLLMNL